MSRGLSPFTKTPVAMPTTSHARKNSVPIATAAAVAPGIAPRGEPPARVEQRPFRPR